MKKQIASIMACFLIVQGSIAQNIFSAFRSTNQQLVEEALHGAVHNITTYYALSDTVAQKQFGRNGKTYFNGRTFMGVRTTRGVVCSGGALTPWHEDKDFESYRTKYVPYLLGKDTLQTLGQLCLVGDTATHEGLSVDSLKGEKKGWLIWWVERTGDDGKPLQEMVSTYKPLNIKSSTDTLRFNYEREGTKVLGGFYVVPQVQSVGHLNFLFTGLLVRDEKAWQLVCPFLTHQIATKNTLTLIATKEDEKE